MQAMEKIKDKYKAGELNAKEALHSIFTTYLISDEKLLSRGLKMKYMDYGIWNLYQNGDYIYDGERHKCLERAGEIMDKREDSKLGDTSKEATVQATNYYDSIFPRCK